MFIDQKKIYEKEKEGIIRERIDLIFSDCLHAGSINTPFNLCREIVVQLPDLNNKEVLILFNPEFYIEVLRKYPLANITFVTGSKNAFTKYKKYGFKQIKKLILVDPFNIEDFNIEMLGLYMQFDVIIGNPPYQAPQNAKGKRGGGKDLWTKFVQKSFDLVKKDGYISFIHPSKWRKPEDKNGNKKNCDLLDQFKERNLKYLELHDAKDGLKTFNAGTRYDWYVLQNTKYTGKTIVINENNQKEVIDITNYSFLPNFDFDKLDILFPKQDEKTCKVLYSRSAYGSDKKWMSKEQNKEFQYPCIHATRKNENILWYSNTKDNGFFGTPKVIFGEGGINEPIIDMNGEYGLTQQAIGIKVDNLQEAKNIKKSLMSDKFKLLIKSCSWSNFRIDWRMFTHFKKDFWKEFV